MIPRNGIEDTIVAVATPPGRGAVGVVRLSGGAAHAVAVALLGRSDRALRPRHATVGRILVGQPRQGSALDEVLCTFFPAPRSYTGEDVVEISAHGSPVVLAQIVEAALGHGVRMARRGEFTFRAFLNGRLDLVQAEAVGDLVDAVTATQAQVAFQQLDGRLSETLVAIEQTIFDLVVRLEACLDFPEEDFHFVSPASARETIAGVRGRIESLRRCGGEGRLIREGATVVLVGRPNVGKSSIFNALVGAERAIVAPESGTTRDLVTEVVEVAGVPVTLVDTAGLRDVDEFVEAEGVARARRAAAVAQLGVVVLDRSAALTPADERIVTDVRGTRSILVVANKCDRAAAWEGSVVAGVLGREVLEVSARTGDGVEALRLEVARALGKVSDSEEARITNVRHLRLLEEADGGLRRAAAALEAGASEEFVLADLRDCILSFDQIVGTRTPDDVLAEIFSRFCIGK